MSEELLLGPTEFFERYQGRYYGKYRALVRDVEDPLKLGRVRVYCATIFGNDLSPWCLPCFPMTGTVDKGCMWVPPLDSLVWIEFEDGMVQNPIYVGGFYGEMSVGRPSDGTPIAAHPNYQANNNPSPMHAQGLLDGSDLDGGVRGEPGVPQSSFRGEYPNVRIMQTPSGHKLEFDDTEGDERILIEHKAGAFIEILNDGTMNIISDGIINQRSRGYRETNEGNAATSITGNETRDVGGNYTLNVGGTYTVNYANEVEQHIPSQASYIGGDDFAEVGGSFSREALNNIQFQCGGNVEIGAFGNMNLQSGGSGSIIFSNSTNVVDMSQETLNIVAQAGRVTIKSTDMTGVAAAQGIVIQSQGFPSMSPIPTVPDIGPFVYLGNLVMQAPGGIGIPLNAAVPLIQEPAVMGKQMVLYLTALQTALTAFCATLTTGGVTPGYGGPNPVLAAAATTLTTALATLQTTWLTPMPTKLQELLVSDVVYLSKT